MLIYYWSFQEVQVRFAGFGPEEDEWVNIKKHVRQRSLPCEASECVAVLPGDLILCFQVGHSTCESNYKSICSPSLREVTYNWVCLLTSLANALMIFRKEKIRLYILTPMYLMHNDEDMM